MTSTPHPGTAGTTAPGRRSGPGEFPAPGPPGRDPDREPSPRHPVAGPPEHDAQDHPPPSGHPIAGARDREPLPTTPRGSTLDRPSIPRGPVAGPPDSDTTHDRPPASRPSGPLRSRSTRVLRAVAYALLPAEVLLAVCLVAGVRPPGPVLLGTEVAVLALGAATAGAYVRLRRSGLSARQAGGELVPEPVLRLAGHELRLMVSLGLWTARRRHGVPAGARAFPHARDQAALLYGFAFVCLVETVGMSYLLVDWPVAHAVVLVLDVYTVLFVLGLHAASVTRPHVLAPGVLRLRQAAHVDLTISLENIAAVRHELLFSHAKTDGELNLAVGSQTSLTFELTEPVDVPRFLGAPRQVRVVRCHADDARAFLEAVTRARTAPSPSRDRPGSA
ncbi:hypothetical protein [Streptomyces sp. NPDC053755]|uniref:hypothetical protein n=1 Tax=Streptomyces sp. NPDC053755 TaxID=3155815 RepID=UPI00342A78E4